MRTADIFLIEDSITDAELITEALKDSQVSHQLKLASDGEEALAYLQGRRRNPHLILLDLNLPKMNGIELLQIVRANPKLRAIPIIILTNSDNQDDVLAAYSKGCNAYVRKPLGYSELVETFELIGRFWFNIVSLPVSVPPKASKAPAKRTSKKRKKRVLKK
jgi:CheY-like chemotaxis protein